MRPVIRYGKLLAGMQLIVIAMFLTALKVSAEQEPRELPMSVYQSQRMTALEAKHDTIIAKQEVLSDRVARIEGIGMGFGGVLVLLNILTLMQGRNSYPTPKAHH